MTEREYKRLTHAKRQYLLRINDTPVAILVDDDDETIFGGCYEASSNGIPKMSENEMNVPISLKPIEDETVLGYATFMLMGIVEQVKKEHKARDLQEGEV